MIEKYVLYYLADSESQRIIVLRVVYGKRDLTEIMKEMEKE